MANAFAQFVNTPSPPAPDQAPQPVDTPANPFAQFSAPAATTPPAMIDPASVHQLVQSNQAAQPSPAEGENPQPASFQDKMDAGAGFPISKTLNPPSQGTAPVPVSNATNAHYLDAVNNGTCSGPADYCQQIANTVAHAVDPQPGGAAQPWVDSIAQGVGTGLQQVAEKVKQTGQAVSGQTPSPTSILSPDDAHKLAGITAAATSQYPEMAAALIGGKIGLMAPGAWKSIAAPVGAAVGAGLTHMAINIAPMYANNLKQTNNNADKAWDLTKKNISTESSFTGLSFAAFEASPFAGILKNVVAKIASQSVISATQKAGQNISTGQPLMQGTGQVAQDAALTNFLLLGGHEAVNVGTHALITGPELHPALKSLVASKLGVPESSVTPEVADKAFANSGNATGMVPPKDFSDVSKAMFGNESGLAGLQAVNRAARVPPVQIFDDAQHDPTIATDIASGKIPAVYADKIETPEDQQAFHEQQLQGSVEKLQAQEKTQDEIQKPVLNFIKNKGGVDPESPIGNELKNIGYTSKNAPGLFRKTGTGGADVFAINDFNQAMSDSNQYAEKSGDNGLVDPNWILDKLRDESHKKVSAPSEDQHLNDLSAEIQQRGIKTEELAKPAKAATVIAEPKLPKDLSGAKTNYGYKDKQFRVKFDSDIDRAMYISAQSKPSARDADYRKFLTDHGYADQEISQHGQAIRDKIKAIAKDGEPGEIKIDRTSPQPKSLESANSVQKIVKGAPRKAADITKDLINSRAADAKTAAQAHGATLTDAEAKEVARIHEINGHDMDDALEQVIGKTPLSDLRDKARKEFPGEKSTEMKPEDWEALENEWKQAENSTNMERVTQNSEKPANVTEGQDSGAEVNGPSGAGSEAGRSAGGGAAGGGSGGDRGGGGPVGGAEGTPERARTDKEIAVDLSDRLHEKAGQDHATDIISMQRELAAKKSVNPKLDEKFYLEKENPGSQDLTKKERALYEEHIKPLHEQEADLYRQIRELKGEKEAESKTGQGEFLPDENEGNKNGYVHRIVKGKGNYLDKYDVDVGGDDDLGFGRNSGISQSTSSLKTPEFYVLEDSNGNRKLESGEYPDDKKPGDTVTDADGNSLTIKRANTEEIEKNTDLKYYKSGVGNTEANIRGLEKTIRNIKFLNDLKSDMQKSGLGVPPSVEDHPSENQQVNIPQLRGWSFDPRIAEVLNDFYDKGDPGMLHQINNLLIKGMFLNPIPHMENILYDSLVSKGFRNLDPRGVSHLAAGIRDVMEFSPEYIDALKNGAALKLPAVWKQGFYEKLQGQFLKEMRGSAEGLDLAKAWGFDTVEHMASNVFNASQKAMWGSGDALLMAKIRELKASDPSMSTKDAIQEAQKHIVDYRIPSRVGENILGPKLSRAMSKALQDNAVVVFTRYHYGLFKSMGNIVKDAAMGAYEKDPKKVAAAAGQIFALMFLAHVVDPAIGAMWSKITNEKEKFRRPGLTGLEGAIEDAITGKEGLGHALASQFIVSPSLKVGADILSDKVIDPTAGHVGVQAADYAMKQPSMSVPSVPYNIREGKSTIGQEALKAIGVTPEKEYKPRTASKKTRAKFENEEENLEGK